MWSLCFFTTKRGTTVNALLWLLHRGARGGDTTNGFIYVIIIINIENINIEKKNKELGPIYFLYKLDLIISVNIAMLHTLLFIF